MTPNTPLAARGESRPLFAGRRISPRGILLSLLAGMVALNVRTPAARPVAAVALGQNSQTEVSLIMSNPASHPKVGLPDFVMTGEDQEVAAAAKLLADVLWYDLDFEREFYMIPRKTSASIPVAPIPALPYAQWAEMGADLVIVGSLTRRGEELSVELRIVGVKGDAQGRETLGRGYPNCRLQNLRGCAHAIADDVHKQARGLDGVARTKLAFTSDRHGSRVSGRPSQTAGTSKEIYISDYDGQNQMRVTVNGSLNCCPAWAPTGGMLSYVSWMSGFPDIYVANLAQPGRLGRPAAGTSAVHNWTPEWSPDGSRLAYASTRSGNLDIWVVNRDGSGLQNLTNSPGSRENTPTWSPNGQQIAFTSDRAGVNQLYVMSATGTGAQLLVSQQIDRPTWSLLGFIAFTVATGAGYDIGIYDFARPGVTILTDGNGSNESPAVAPNGRHVAYMTTRWGKQQIAIIDRRGERNIQITNSGDNGFPNWQRIAALSTP
jgi:TolB protein